MQQLELDSDFKDSDEDEGDKHSLNVKSFIIIIHYWYFIETENLEINNNKLLTSQEISNLVTEGICLINDN